jgi:hypothetical protein
MCTSYVKVNTGHEDVAHIACFLMTVHILVKIYFLVINVHGKKILIKISGTENMVQLPNASCNADCNEPIA